MFAVNWKNDDEIVKLLDWALVHEPDRHDVYHFALLTGFWAGEIQSMTPAAFDWQAKTITVHSKDTRNHDRVDTVPMHADLRVTLTKRCAGKASDQPIFNLPDRTATVLQRDCTAAKIDAQT